MALMRWNPWGEVLSIQKDVNSLFNDFFSGRDRDTALAETGEAWCCPLVDVSEADEEFIVRAELPGLSEKDVKVSITENTLSIRGEKKHSKEEKEKTFHRIERSYGAFERTFGLGTHVEPGKAKAMFKDGVLEIRLPKVGEEKAKEIPINKG